MSARWGNDQNKIPFPPSEFITPTPEQLQRRAEHERKLEIINQRTMASILEQVAIQQKNARDE